MNWITRSRSPWNRILQDDYAFQRNSYLTRWEVLWFIRYPKNVDKGCRESCKSSLRHTTRDQIQPIDPFRLILHELLCILVLICSSDKERFISIMFSYCNKIVSNAFNKKWHDTNCTLNYFLFSGEIINRYQITVENIKSKLIDIIKLNATLVFGKVHRTAIVNFISNGNDNVGFRWSSDGTSDGPNYFTGRHYFLV